MGAINAGLILASLFNVIGAALIYLMMFLQISPPPFTVFQVGVGIVAVDLAIVISVYFIAR